jgi:flavin reductase (DIM6/NTAB) family NADH-FMN oxidoreductase RutF
MPDDLIPLRDLPAGVDPGENPMRTILGREIAALLNPRPLVLVTCCDAQGRPNVMTAAWQTPLSHEPPLLGVSIDLRRYSHALLQQVGELVVNVVGPGFEEALLRCGNASGRDVDKLAAFGLRALPARCVHPPLIAGALAHLECEVVQQVPTGDHTLFVSRVVYAQAVSQCFSDGWEAPGGQVLLCIQRDRFATWTSTKPT